MNSIVQCSVLILLCFASWVQAQCDDDSIRLTGGPNKFEGRVEICKDGSWGQVCAMEWTRDDAQVVCRQLGHSANNPLKPVSRYVYGGETTPALVNRVRCNGDEEQLVDCLRVLLDGSSSCAAYLGAAGVVCKDPECLGDPTSVRLSKIQAVEVCAGGYRTGVCSSNWDDTDASVVCRQLSLGDNGVASSIASVFYMRAGGYARVNCTNSDQTLSDCEHSLIGSGGDNPCRTGQFAQVECKAFAATTAPPAATTTPQVIDSTTTSFEDSNSTSGAGTNPAQSTAGPGSVQPQSDPLLAIILGVVGGLIALLLIAIVLLLVIIAVRKKCTPQSFKEDRYDPAAANLQAIAEQNATVIYEEILSLNSVNGQLDDTYKHNETYQTSAAMIESKENKVYGVANTEVFTSPNEAYHIPGSAAMIESKENEAYGALTTSMET